MLWCKSIFKRILFMFLSNIFKFTQSLWQRWHQIWRKVWDAIEVLTLWIIYQNEDLVNHLKVEEWIEGATTAKHKVEFAFYNDLVVWDSDIVPENLFWLIECKKVWVEQTVKGNFKTWEKAHQGIPFYETDWYSFSFNPWGVDKRYIIDIKPCSRPNSLDIDITTIRDSEEEIQNIQKDIQGEGDILFVLNESSDVSVIYPSTDLVNFQGNISKCVIFQIKKIDNNRVSRIKVNESLPWPQTPEKAKQASFVSLDVRKRVLWRFDKSEDTSFISILVIWEASHWEEKSRSMIRLCNDYNLVIPDEIIIEVFNRFKEQYGDSYQDKITKAFYQSDDEWRAIINDIIMSFEGKILKDMDTNCFVEFCLETWNNGKKLLKVRNVSS